MTFKTYCKGIAPTFRGTLVILSMVFLLPLLVELIIFCTGLPVAKDFNITLFMMMGYVKILVGLVFYHLSYFIVQNFVLKYFKNVGKF